MWPDSEQTAELLDGARRGEPQAVNSLLDRHRDALRRMIRMRLDRAVSQRVDASDVLQDVLLEASRRLDDYLRDPKLPFHLWLRQLAKDRIIDTHRRHRAAGRRSVDREQSLRRSEFDCSSFDGAAQFVDRELTPAAATLRRELQRRFLAALDELSEEDREVIVMRHFEHLGNSEAAQALGLTPPAAGMRYLRALRRLRAALGESVAAE
jgi:RNA polymerase sigma-70 factor (ECF subfamily)